MSDLNIPENAVAAYDTMQNQLGQDAYEPTDAEFFQWVQRKSGREIFETFINDCDDTAIGALLKFIVEPRNKSSESDNRDLVSCSMMRGHLSNILKKAYLDECSEWFDNGGKL